MHMRLIAAAALALALPSFASVVWKGDFETGDRSQWSETQMVSPDRLAVVSSPVTQGQYALKVTVKQGDNPINSSGNRNELVHATPQPEGSESWYAWSTMFASDYPSEHTWQVFTQWHQPEDCCGSPPVQFQVIGEEISLTLSTAETMVWHAPLVRGVWHRFVLHIRFSDNPNVGFAELWYDGTKVLEKTNAATRANTYLKQGLYRNSSIAADGVVFHDGMIQGTTQEDVMPAASASAPPATVSSSVDAGTPAPPPPATTSDGGVSDSLSTVADDGLQSGSPQAPAAGCSVGVGGLSLLSALAVAAFSRRRQRKR